MLPQLWTLAPALRWELSILSPLAREGGIARWLDDSPESSVFLLAGEPAGDDNALWLEDDKLSLEVWRDDGVWLDW